MKTTIQPVSSVEFDFVVEIPATELTPYIETKLKQLRPKVQMNGFRKGKVPAHLVKKLYGEAAAYEVVDKFVQDTYEEEVIENPEYKTIGRPQMTVFDYKLDGDLKSVIRFGVRPVFDLVSLEGQTISKLVNPVTDEDVEGQVEYLRTRESVLEADENPVGEKSVLKVDMTEINPETQEVLEDGRKETGATIVMNDPNLMPAFKDALLGKVIGDEVNVHVNTVEDHGDHSHEVKISWHVKILEIQARILPEIDEEFIKKVSFEQATNEQELRDQIREASSKQREQRSHELLEDKVVKKAVELHNFEVPSTLVSVFLDQFVKAFKDQMAERNQGQLPDWFDAQFNEAGYRESRYAEAERTAKWMLLRDALIEAHKIEATDEDLNAHFEEMAASFGGALTGEAIRGLYESNMAEQLDVEKEKILSRKAVMFLLAQATVVEKSRKDFEQEEKEEQSAEIQAQIGKVAAQLETEKSKENGDAEVIEDLEADLEALNMDLNEVQKDTEEAA